MLGSLFKSMTGLIGFTQSLDNLSNNVANLNTPGYKGNDLLFRELGSESFSSNGDNGNGLNHDIGDGVRIAGTVTRFTQGDIKQTGGETDLAIDGMAFFVLDGNGAEYYTRSGQFRFDERGYLIDPGTGFRVLALNDSGRPGHLNIRDFEFSNPIATTEMQLRGTLNGAATANSVYPAASADPLTISVFDSAGQEHTLHISFTKQQNRAWNISITNEDGALVAPQHRIDFTSLGSIVSSVSEFNFDYQEYHLLEQQALQDSFNPGAAMVFGSGHSTDVETAFTLSDAHLILRDTDSFEFTQQGTFVIDNDGFLVDPDTSLRVASRTAEGAIVDFSVAGRLEAPAEATTNISLAGNLNADTAVGSNYPPDAEPALQYEYIDDDGAIQTLQIRFTREATNRWSVGVENAEGVNIDVAGALFFNTSGQLVTSTSAIEIQLSDHNGTDIEFDLTGEDGTTTLTALAAESSVTQTGYDGIVTGLLTTVTFSEDGIATLNYSNGEEETGPQLAVVELDGEPIEGLRLDLSRLTSVASGQNNVQIEDVDGRALGQITGYQFNEFGELEINYSNGDETRSNPIALASILDRTQLYAVGNTLYRLQEGGERILGNAANDALAKIAPRSLELSNVELSREFADIIIVQRGYQASSQVLNVTNQMIEELYNTVKGR